MTRVTQFLITVLLAIGTVFFALSLFILTITGVFLGLLKELFKYYSRGFAIELAEFKFPKTITSNNLKGETRKIFELPKGRRMIYVRDK
jgi:hypothetical protein